MIASSRPPPPSPPSRPFGRSAHRNPLTPARLALTALGTNLNEDWGRKNLHIVSPTTHKNPGEEGRPITQTNHHIRIEFRVATLRTTVSRQDLRRRFAANRVFRNQFAARARVNPLWLQTQLEVCLRSSSINDEKNETCWGGIKETTQDTFLPAERSAGPAVLGG